MSIVKLLPLAALCALLGACDTREPPAESASETSGETAQETTQETTVSAELPLGEGVTLPPFTEVELDNGASLVLMERHDVPLVAFQARVRSGSVVDPEGKSGTAALTAGLLEKGAGERDARAFAEAVASVGGAFSTSVGTESVSVTGEFMAKDVDLMVELLADALTRPRFEAEEFDKLRERRIRAIQAAKDSSPSGLLSAYARPMIFSDHPYARRPSGDEAGLGEVTLDDVRAYYRNRMGGDRLQLTVVGDFDTETMQRKLAEALGSWRTAEAPREELPLAVLPAAGRVLLVDKPGASQTYFWIGDIGVPADFEHQAALDVANTAFGGRFTSMLNQALRIDSGLSYGAGSHFWQPSGPGYFAITSFTQKDTTAEAMDLALATLERLHGEGLDPQTLRSVQAYILGQFPPDLETAKQLANELAEIRFHGLGRDAVDSYAERIKAVDTAAAQTMINGVFPAREELVFVVIGDADTIREDLSAYGEVTEISIQHPMFTAPAAD